MQATSSIKHSLHQRCLAIAEERIVALQNILTETQQAANNETKSSAGDKHETGRAMAQLETEKLTTQLSELHQIKQYLTQIPPPLSVAHYSMFFQIKTNVQHSVSLRCGQQAPPPLPHESFRVDLYFKRIRTENDHKRSDFKMS